MSRAHPLRCRCGSEQFAFLRGQRQPGGWAVCRKCARVTIIGERLEPRKLSPARHRKRHQLLHRLFDELPADFLRQNRYKLPSETSVMELATWSHQQTIEPTEPE